jgi:hypothetical protein
MNGEWYSPERRTALLLTGTGTSGAYHAGVLRALQEAGVKIDVVAGCGIGAIGALFAAVDGAQRLWEENGFWRSAAIEALYPWQPVFRLAVWTLVLSFCLVAVPLAAIAAGLIVFPVDFVLKMVGVSAASGLATRYLSFVNAAFSPEALPTWLPRLVLIVLGLSAFVACAGAWTAGNERHKRGAIWWRLVRPPLSASSAVERCWSMMWDLLRGAARLKAPPPVDLARRYTDLLAENLGQPGFRELLVAVHDVDARRDLVVALVAEPRRRDLIRRATTREAEARRAEVVDLMGIARSHLVDAVAGSLSIPLTTDLHTVTFAADSYWRGETHRLCDRPASLWRLIEELTALEVEQVILVSAAPDAAAPHTLERARFDGRGRLGEHLQSSEAAIIRDIGRALADGRPNVFVIRPAHNPIGPFEFSGGFDDRSDRRQPLAELLGRGYEDAYHQFIEPIVGASGERLGAR